MLNDDAVLMHRFLMQDTDTMHQGFVQRGIANVRQDGLDLF